MESEVVDNTTVTLERFALIDYMYFQLIIGLGGLNLLYCK